MLKNRPRICDLVGVDFPLFAFTHHKEVVAAVSRAGGFGVLGVVGFGPGALERELQWIDEHVDGMPYGIDLAVPEKLEVQKNEERLTTHILRARIPDAYWRFTYEFLERFDIEPRRPPLRTRTAKSASCRTTPSRRWTSPSDIRSASSSRRWAVCRRS